MKPVLTPKEANDLMRDAGDDTSLETFKRGLRQGKYPGGLYIAAEAEGQSAVYKVYALPFLAWMRDVFPLADAAIESRGGRMSGNKKRRPVLAHQSGKGKTFTIILPLLRGAVKAAGVTLGVYILAALAVLNVPALVAAILIENALVGIYFKIGGIGHEKV